MTSRILLCCALLALTACKDKASKADSGTGSNAVTSDSGTEQKHDASKDEKPDGGGGSVPLDAGGGSTTVTPVCPTTGTCQSEYGEDQGVQLVCIFGRCFPEPMACTDNACPSADQSCLQNLETYCPECSREEGCVLQARCERASIDEEECPRTEGQADASTGDCETVCKEPGDAGGDAGCHEVCQGGGD